MIFATPPNFGGRCGRCGIEKSQSIPLLIIHIISTACRKTTAIKLYQDRIGEEALQSVTKLLEVPVVAI